MIKEFEYFNPNPRGIRTGDCVIRALCKALNRDWMPVYKELFETSIGFCTLPNTDEVWQCVLMLNGFEQKSIPRPKKGQKSMNVGKFCKEYSTGTYILKCAHHICCVKDGVVYDLCPEVVGCKVYNYWEKVK